MLVSALLCCWRRYHVVVADEVYSRDAFRRGNCIVINK